MQKKQKNSFLSLLLQKKLSRKSKKNKTKKIKKMQKKILLTFLFPFSLKTNTYIIIDKHLISLGTNLY